MDDFTKFTPNIVRYEALMDVVRNRLTSRAFRPDVAVPRAYRNDTGSCAPCAIRGLMPSLGTALWSPIRR